MVLGAASVISLLLLSRGDRFSLGLTLRMRPGYRYWMKATLLIGVAVGLFSTVGMLSLHAAGIHLPTPTTPPDRILSSLVSGCISAPLTEEAMYRLVFCVPLAALVGSRTTIVLAGATFAGLHFVYRNPGPDNFIAGFFLAWAFLKSGSMLTPILLHSLGNACAVASQVIDWYRMA